MRRLGVVGPEKKIEGEEQNIMSGNLAQVLGSYHGGPCDGTPPMHPYTGYAKIYCKGCPENVMCSLPSTTSMTTFEKSFVNCRNTIDDKYDSLVSKQYNSDAEEKKIIHNEIQKIQETNESCIYMYKQLPQTCKKEGHCKDSWSKKIKHRNMVCDGLKFFDNPDVRDFCLKKESTNLGHTSFNNIEHDRDCSEYFNNPLEYQARRCLD